MRAWTHIALVALVAFAAGRAVAQEPPAMRDREYVSLLGRQVLSQTDSLVRCKILSTYPMASGVTVGRLEVLEVLDGIDPGRQVSVLAGDDEQFPEPGLEVLVFASRLSSESLWRAAGLFFLGDELGQIKLRVVRQLLEIEAVSDTEARVIRLRQLSVQNVGEVDPWLAWNAAQELFHIVFVLGVDLEERERHRLSDLTMQSGDDRLSGYLQTILLGLRSRSGGALGGFLPESGVVVGLPDPTAAGGEALPSAAGTLRQMTEEFLAADDPAEASGLLHRLSAYPLPFVDRLLVRSLQHREADVRATAAFLLGRADPDLAVAHLARTLDRDPDLRVRLNAAKSLGRLGGEEAASALIRGLDDPGTRLDRLAALGQIGSTRARAVLAREQARLPAGPSRERALLDDLLEQGR